VRAQQECCLGFVVRILEERRCDVLVGLLDSRFSSAQPPGWSSPLKLVCGYHRPRTVQMDQRLNSSRAPISCTRQFSSPPPYCLSPRAAAKISTQAYVCTNGSVPAAAAQEHVQKKRTLSPCFPCLSVFPVVSQ
jgi:hypothetical protein